MRCHVTAAVLAAAFLLTLTVGGGLAAEQPAEKDHPALLFIQGKLKPGAGPVYEQYLAGTRPLMAEYGVRVLAVGAGLASPHTSDTWPVNAVLRFPSRDAAERFLSDPRYLEIKARFRDRAYQTLHLSLVAGRPPRIRTPRQVAEEAFGDFRHGLESGEWDGFLARLAEGFTLHFPMGKFQGEHRGREEAARFFRYVSETFSEGIEIVEGPTVTAEGDRVVFEFSDRGTLRGAPYRNRIAISLDVCGDQICGYREYFGLVGPPPDATAKP